MRLDPSNQPSRHCLASSVHTGTTTRYVLQVTSKTSILRAATMQIACTCAVCGPRAGQAVQSASSLEIGQKVEGYGRNMIYCYNHISSALGSRRLEWF